MTDPQGGPDAAGDRSIVLVGMMGSGKTAAGRLLARRLNRDLLDLDALVEARAGRCVAAIFAEEGEQGFRAREAAVLSELTGRPPVVVACGGGVILDPANVAALRACGTVVWLQVSPTVAAGRLGAGEDRPVLAAMSGSLEERLSTLMAQRAQAYRAAAHLVVDADGPLRDVVERLVSIATAAAAPAGAGSRP
ncbi:MAG: shikimate kinase [Actinomycetota bacterium]